MGFHHRMVAVLEAAGSLVAQQVAVTSGHGLDQGQGPGADGSKSGRADVLRIVVEDLNPVLRGWGAYFRQGNSSAKFGAIDSYVHETDGQAGQQETRAPRDQLAGPLHWSWLGSLGVYRLTGTVRYPAAHALR